MWNSGGTINIVVGVNDAPAKEWLRNKVLISRKDQWKYLTYERVQI